MHTHKIIGIVLLLNQQASARVVEFSQGFTPHAREQDDPLVLSNDGRLPHLSLFHLRVLNAKVEGDGLQQLGKTLHDVVFPPCALGVEIKLTSVEMRPGGWVFWCAETSLHLKTLHLAIAEAFAPLRDQDPDYRPTWIKTDAQRRSFDQYGYPNAGDAFDPHVTLAVVRDGTTIPAQPLLMSWASHIAIVRVGKWGAAEEVLLSIPLQPIAESLASSS